MLKSIQHFAYIAVLMAALALLASCTGGKKRYVIGVSQCSEDVWREKLNQELRVAALYYNNMDLDIASANDDVRLQTDQINRFVDKGVDLLIVAPGQVSISPAIDRAYEKGIPVIIFDRRTRSNKYTAYIGADNREIGESMGEYLAGALPKGGRVVELCGLSSSSPAIERAEGFDSVVAVRPSIDIVAKLHADWTEQGGFRAMDSLLRSPHPDSTASLPTTTVWRWAHVGQRRSTDWTSSASASAESMPCRRREPDWNLSRTGRSLLPISIRRVATR